jgi:hypothetical protein
MLFVTVMNPSAMQWGSIVFIITGYFLYNLFYVPLLFDISIEQDSVTLKFYTVIFKKEELALKTGSILDLKHEHSNFIVFQIEGTNGPINKKFYLHLSPWDKLNFKLTELKSVLQQQGN